MKIVIHVPDTLTISHHPRDTDQKVKDATPLEVLNLLSGVPGMTARFKRRKLRKKKYRRTNDRVWICVS